MNQNTICRYETGAREADYETLVKIADYFNVSIDYLLYRTDNPEINKEKNRKFTQNKDKIRGDAHQIFWHFFHLFP